MRISEEQRPEYLDFANRVLDVNFDPKNCTWITNLSDDGELLAVVVYSRFGVYNCEMSVASNGGKRWFSRQFAKQCYSYPFIQCGLTRITGVVEEGNEAAFRMNRQLGHIEEARLKKWFGEKDGIVFRMLKSECKWL